VHYALLAIIVAAVVALIVGTMPSVDARWGAALRRFDLAVGALFAVEYLVRLWTAPVDPRYADGWRGRWRWARSPLAVLDLVAVVAILTPQLALDLRQARLVRLLALLRIGKLGRFGQSVTMAGRILRSRREDLLVALGAIALLLLVGSTLVYFAEHDAQPEKFSSVPDTLWWGIVTVTTVGYGDVYPVTTLGRVLGGAFAMLGIASFALPTAILGAAFVEELQRMRELRGETHCPTCGQPVEIEPAALPHAVPPHAPPSAGAGAAR
jgi:voltage-gated potassium channel